MREKRGRKTVEQSEGKEAMMEVGTGMACVMSIGE